MSRPYEELLHGQKLLRPAPGVRHELICGRLHELMLASVADLGGFRLVDSRATISLSDSTQICPDLALINTETGSIFLAVEVVSREDHRMDTVTKKEIYEEFGVPRLWMVDPRYDNVEVYHTSDYGLKLKSILAGQEILSETSLPEFAVVIAELFAGTLPPESQAGV
jgi:Uma2 family endonuclease